MKALEDAIVKEGSVLPGGILKVDSIVNHQIQPFLMINCAMEVKNKLNLLNLAPIDRILTAEVSGIAFAFALGYVLGTPVVFARKLKPITISGPVYLESAPSHTKGGTVDLLVSSEFMPPNQNVLIADDFLASGKTLNALAKIVLTAQSKVTAIACLIEKEFECGKTYLLSQNIDCPIISLARITRMTENKIEFS